MTPPSDWSAPSPWFAPAAARRPAPGSGRWRIVCGSTLAAIFRRSTAADADPTAFTVRIGEILRLVRRAWIHTALCALASLHWMSEARAAPAVVASIKPVHALVAGVMGEAGMPRLIVDGVASPHTYQMRPSDAAALRNADLVVWVGGTMETFLARPIASLGTDAEVVTLQHATGMQLLPYREGGLWKAGPHEAGETENSHGRARGDDQGHHRLDTHIWLNPANARRTVEAVAAALARIHPEGAAAYRRNADTMQARITALESTLRQRLEPVRSRAFVVFHDGYQYFERAFGLNGIGAVTLGPARLPGAKRLASLRRALVEREVRCVFTEPQFEPRLVETVIERTAVRTAVLDPLGADVAAGSNAWFVILRRMGDTIAECLGDA